MRDQLLALSVDFQTAPLDIRERVALPHTEITAFLRSMPEIFAERLMLSTCNRLEIYVLALGRGDAGDLLTDQFATARGLPPSALSNYAVLYREADAARHLFRVAAGLESMVLGEPQILSQIRDAVALARDAGTAGPILQRLATDALHAGKRARTETAIARNRCSIAHVAVDVAATELHGLDGRRALVMGAGKTGSLVAKLLGGSDVADLVILNRSPETGRRLAQAVGGRFAPLAELPRELAGAELAITAASVPQPLIGPRIIRRAGMAAPLLAIDLGVPRNIDPAVKHSSVVHLIDLDQLRPDAEARRRLYVDEIQAVAALTDRATEEFVAWCRGRAAVTTIAALHGRSEEIRAVELDHALAKLGHLSERDRNVVSALSFSLVNKLLHQPSRTLRETSQPELMADVAQQLFGLSESATIDS